MKRQAAREQAYECKHDATHGTRGRSQHAGQGYLPQAKASTGAVLPDATCADATCG